MYRQGIHANGFLFSLSLKVQISGLLISVPMCKELGSCHTHPCDKKNLDKPSVNDFSWAHWRNELTGTSTTLRSEELQENPENYNRDLLTCSSGC